MVVSACCHNSKEEEVEQLFVFVLWAARGRTTIGRDGTKNKKMY
jgi:hypothetical protein